MSKRFTDTEKWGKAWLRKLPPKFKCAWFYLLDKCDHAGIWHEDFEAMSFNIGEEIEPNEFESIFKGKVSRIDGDKFFINSFIEYQYGNLNPLNKVHKSVIDKLEKFKVYYKGLGSPMDEAKDKDKDKEKDKDKDKEKEEESDLIPTDLLQSIKMQFGFPDDVIEQYRKQAWVSYLASDRWDKNWKRFVGNYFANNQEKIRKTIKDQALAKKNENNDNPDLLAMVERIYSTVLGTDPRQKVSGLTEIEFLALDIFGGRGEINNNPLMGQVKSKLKTACAQALSERKEAG